MICPRCGMPGTQSIERRGGREYVYYVHVVNRRRYKHYIGPINQYTYVEKLHRLNLRNIQEIDYIAVVISALNRYVELKRSSNSRQELSLQLRRVVEFCEKKIRELEAEHNQAKNS